MGQVKVGQRLKLNAKNGKQRLSNKEGYLLLHLRFEVVQSRNSPLKGSTLDIVKELINLQN